MVTGINRISEQTLAHILTSGKLLAPGEALAVLREIVRQVVDLHSSGQLHLGITLDAISTGPAGIELKRAESTASLESLRELLKWSPEASHRLPRSLPTNLVAARQILHSSRVSTDPCTFDLLAIGDVFCRILTGESSAAYRQSVRVKGLVPAELRTLLERLLGADGQSSFESAQSLWDFLQEHCRNDSAENAIVPDRTDDFQPSPTPTGHNSNTGVSSKQADKGAAPRPVKRSVSAKGTETLPIQSLGHFEIQARIGHGGMGDVYRARDRSLDRTVAIKVLPAEFARQKDFVRRFQAEASAVAKLVHPNIIQIYFSGIDSGHHFFAMQYVDGYSLAVLLNEKKKLSVNTAVSLVEQVLLGLQEAHSLGFVHRDIKPGNILIDRVKKRALLADFGLVKMVEGSETGKTATGVILGTVDYLSPEQGLGKDVDARSDLYSVGVLLYHILSGRLPFIADTPTALIFKHVYEQPQPLSEVVPQLARQLATIVNKLMQKNPVDRYQSAQDVLTDFAAFRNNQPLVIASQSGSDRRNEKVRSPPDSDSPIETLTFVEEADLAVETSAWQRWLTGWRAKFQQHAPQRLLDLQNTQQQVQGGLAVYETRRDKLEKLVREAQDVRDELARAAAQSRGKSDAASLEQQLAVQEEQLDDLKLKLAKVSSRFQQLLSQRDLLNARLKAAGAQLKSDGQITSRRISRRTLALVAATASILVVAIFIIGPLVRQPQPAPVFPPGPTPAVAPFDAAHAKTQQEAWAKHLGVPVEYTNSIGMKFRLIPPGEFSMGSSGDFVARTAGQLASFGVDNPRFQSFLHSEQPQHRVMLTQPIYLGVYEVTQREYAKVMGMNPSHMASTGAGREAVGSLDTSSHPVENMSWNDAIEFTVRLSQQEKLSPSYSRSEGAVTLIEGTGYRLPTEAEWEFACGAGTTSLYWNGDTDEAAYAAGWVFGNSSGRSHPVGQLKPNPFGLFDVVGNVFEFVQDGWIPGTYKQMAVVMTRDPRGPSPSGPARVFRGGNWRDVPYFARTAARLSITPDQKSTNVGFRVALPIAALQSTSTTSDAVIGERMTSADDSSATADENGQRIRNSIGMDLALIPAGTFLMGSSPREVGRDPDEQQHLVQITQPFFMGIHEVTRGQFEQFVTATGYKTNAETDGKGGFGEYPGVGGRYEKRFNWRNSGHEQTSEHPVGNVTWYDANAFVRWLSEKENVVYRLPTEAESEYACRAGTQTPFQTGTIAADVVKLANVADQTLCNELTTKYKRDVSTLQSTPGSDGFVYTAPVGSLAPNPFGLYDMIGNVDEWCSDWFDHNYFRNSPVIDPTGPETGVFRSFRGGSWGSIVQHMRCANRSRFEPDHRAHHIGFRVVRNVAPNTAGTNAVAVAPVQSVPGQTPPDSSVPPAPVKIAEVTAPSPSAGTEALIEGLDLGEFSETFAKARAAYDRSPQDSKTATRFINLIEELGISLSQEGNQQRANKAFIQAVELVDAAVNANVRIEAQVSSLVYYNGACAKALENKPDDAMVLLEKSMERGFGYLDQLPRDADLAAVRSLPNFPEKLAAWEAKARELALRHARVKLAGSQTLPFSFELTDVTGTPLRLADFRGKVCVVNVWGTWAQPSINLIPSFIRLQKEFGPQGFQVIGMNLEGADTPELMNKLVRDHIAALGINYPCALVSNDVVAQIPRYRMVPTTLFIDRSGRIRAETHGWDEYYHLEAMVSALLAETAPEAPGADPAIPAEKAAP
jgi:formylglycine-generating enzyme required for sulfatase activity/serine/threonine protein kinase/thiol-disulfide isomerase/thioredoxin